jgi:hypothetical protein
MGKSINPVLFNCMAIILLHKLVKKQEILASFWNAIWPNRKASMGS